MDHCAERFFVGFWKAALLAELQAWTSRSSKFLLFLKHRCLVTLTQITIWLYLAEPILVRSWWNYNWPVIFVLTRILFFCSEYTLPPKDYSDVSFPLVKGVGQWKAPWLDTGCIAHFLKSVSFRYPSVEWLIRRHTINSDLVDHFQVWHHEWTRGGP